MLRSCASANDGPLVPYLRICPSDQGIRVRWDEVQLKSRKVEEIRVSVNEEDGSGGTMEAKVNVNDGVVDIDGLRPSTLYAVEVEGYRQATRVFANCSVIKTRQSAPPCIEAVEGRALSATEIYLTWSDTEHPNVTVKSYLATCVVATAPGSSPIRASTKDNETLSVTVGGLNPDAEYRCTVFANGEEVNEHNPPRCRGREMPITIRTMALGALKH
ncbi:unnamed protein product [Hydatigera taeniaeformis]|uniref:Fibronectin type-III domain-containing protein n=1 Tax=Hydatigena taeniaeformis TaxID=6205 RepID=A0A0R3WXS9_HYDTA|nr:unnamed protein product [Hydatigera taeniaeformis]